MMLYKIKCSVVKSQQKNKLNIAEMRRLVRWVHVLDKIELEKMLGRYKTCNVAWDWMFMVKSQQKNLIAGMVMYGEDLWNHSKV